MRLKYLDGFPEAFDPFIAAERMAPGQGQYIYPAVYPAHYPAALAGNAHPQANEPNLWALARALCVFWKTCLETQILQNTIKIKP